MIRFVNAKLNLGLNVVTRRPDGYHELETLFYPVGLYNGTPENATPFCDILEVSELPDSDADRFSFSGRTIYCPIENNLCYKALSVFRTALGDNPEANRRFKISLYKAIPDGAGLGGGSADATFVLKELNALCGTPFSNDTLADMALKLGADCPFFIENTPAFAKGVGEKLQPVSLSLAGMWTVIIKPPVYVSTREAFKGITPAPPARSILEIISLPVAEWQAAGLINDFEAGIFALHPHLKELKAVLYDGGALYASMSGSGSSLFGIFSTRESAERLYADLAARIPDCETFLCKL
ncbi:MAG: 4-(cytidine 5'-diphospho)-2-C-methyl-D-erythritol kinase [Muribaculaceae bacterium]|nr:4-(cytidine 5'-diphospho)-2-C-methyl-D-erythritol kinase [Muribaculaceae bacterium]